MSSTLSQGANDGTAKGRLAPGGWLHLDVALGCAGDMLTAALLDLGVPESALREGLLAAGLLGLGPRVREDRRGPARGLHLTYLDQQGRPLQIAGEPPPARVRRVPAEGRRKGPAPHREHRPPKAALAVARAEGVPDGARGAEVFAGAFAGGSGQPGKTAARASEAPEEAGEERGGRIARWLEDEPAPAEEMLEQLAASRLAPIPRALARKALRRFVDGWESALGKPRSELVLPGRAALDALADVVGVASLVAWLDPAQITSTPVAVSTAAVDEGGTLVPGPSTWVLRCAEGLRLLERDLPYECTTPTGAALVWALAHRSGPRGLVVERARGTGLGTYEVREQANVCRVLYADAPLVDAREGSEPAPARGVFVSAVLSGIFDRPALMTELVRAGATGAVTSAVTDDRGGAATLLSLAAGAAELDEVRRLLFAHGAAEVAVSDAERHRPAVREVTVPVGSAKKRQPVRVVEVSFSGAILRAEPRADDLDAAARLLGRSPAEMRADALAAWRRLSENREGDEDR